MTSEELSHFLHASSWQSSRLGLERMETLMTLLGHPERQLRFIHVAGTNGKGSIAAMLSSILTQAGYTTGMYTSPHLLQVNERMKINGIDISNEELLTLAESVRLAVEEMSDPPTEFERITAMALLYFQRRACQVVVLEVGLGGRLDATNVIPAPDAAVIANIALEHTAVLGNTLEQIAREKAGIIKKGSSVVLYRQGPSVEAVVRDVCQQQGASLFVTDPARGRTVSRTLEGQTLNYRDRNHLFLPLPGAYQAKNAFAALEAVDALVREKGYRISEEAIRRGVALVRWPGRLEVLRHDPLVLVDGAHNPDGVEALTASLKEYFSKKRLTFVMGVMADKNYVEMLRMVTPLARRFITVTPESERALSSAQLADQIRRQFHIPAQDGGSISSGLSLALTLCSPEDVICVFGSLYQAGIVREFFLGPARVEAPLNGIELEVTK